MKYLIIFLLSLNSANGQSFFSNSFFSDDSSFFERARKMMEQSMEEMNALSEMDFSNEAYESQWVESKDGQKFVIIPKNPQARIEVKVDSSMIRIETEIISESASSRFVSSQSVPRNLDGSKAEQRSEKGNIVIYFPYQNEKVSGSHQMDTGARTFLKPNPEDIEI